MSIQADLEDLIWEELTSKQRVRVVVCYALRGKKKSIKKALKYYAKNMGKSIKELLTDKIKKLLDDNGISI